MIIREFKTDAECEAYIMGVSDGEGWMDYYPLENDSEHDLEIKKVIKQIEGVA